MIVEGLTVYVQQGMWDKVCAGDTGARTKLQDLMNGVDVYFHAIIFPEETDPNKYWIPISVTTLYDIGIIDRVTLHRDK